MGLTLPSGPQIVKFYVTVWQTTLKKCTKERVGHFLQYNSSHSVASSDEGLTLETAAFHIFHAGNSTFINSFDSCFTLPPTPHYTFPSNWKFALYHKRLFAIATYVWNSTFLRQSEWRSFTLRTYYNLLKPELRIPDFQHFHWLTGHRLSAHIPALPNMVNEPISK